jgi:hypothetical protein
MNHAAITLRYFVFGLALAFISGVVVAQTPAPGVAPAPAPTNKVVQSLAEVDPDLEDAVTILIPAMTDRNLKIVYGDLYSPIVDQMSKGKGIEELMKRDNAKTILKTTFIKIKAPFQFISTPQHDFVIIPTLSKFNLDESQSQTIAHLLSTGWIMAVRDHGKQKWQFVYDYVMRGDQAFHSDPRKQFFPDLPATAVLPDMSTSFVND